MDGMDVVSAQCGRRMNEEQSGCISFLCECKGNRPVIERLSAQGRPDSRGGLHCFWGPNQT
jgi:hypothetical protein